MKRNLFFILFLFLVAGTVFGQGSELAVHFFGIGSIPNGDFGEKSANDTKLTRRSGFQIGDKIGLAGSGYGAGFELISPIGISSIQWIFSSKTIINVTKSESVEQEFTSELGSIVELEYGTWLNIPVMSGFRYDYLFTSGVTLYGTLQGGVNFSKLASRKATVENVTVEETEFDFARDFGFECGFGLLFNQRYNLGFRYLNLSTPRFDGNQKLSETVFPGIFSRENTIMGEERSISMFIMTFGIQLFK